MDDMDNVEDLADFDTSLNLNDDDDNDMESVTPMPSTSTPAVVEASTPNSRTEETNVDSWVIDEVDDDAPTLTPEVLSLDKNKNDGRRVFIITYSQADERKFPTRQGFGSACVAACGGGSNVYCFAVGREPHKEGGFHYHVSILCAKMVRWKKPWKYLRETYGITVNISTAPVERQFYDGAYAYTTKWDRNYYHGHVLKKHASHQELLEAASDRRREIAKAANAASTSAAKGRRQGKEPREKKEKRVDRLDLLDFIAENNLKTDEELLSCVDKRRKEMGDQAIARAITLLNEKKRNDLIKDAWKLKNAPATVAALAKSRMELIREIAGDKSNCICEEYGLWLVMAYGVCEKNNIEIKTMSNAFLELMEQGRGKGRNIILTGQRNCAKTFLLEPLTHLFGEQCFHTPPSSTFGWMGVDKSLVVYLNDYRWKPDTNTRKANIAWDELLRLLEGHTCKLPAPMNSCSEHISIRADNDIPIFCTSRALPRWYREYEDEPQTILHKKENDMMIERWKEFKMTYVFEKEERVDVPPCKFCFCKFILT